MKIRLIITDPMWEHQLRVSPQLPGAFYVRLTDVAGGRLKHGPVIGPYPTLDVIVTDVEQIYLRLVAMYQQPPSFPAAPARDNSQITKPTTTATETKTKNSSLPEYEYTGHTGLRPVE